MSAGERHTSVPAAVRRRPERRRCRRKANSESFLPRIRGALEQFAQWEFEAGQHFSARKHLLFPQQRELTSGGMNTRRTAARVNKPNQANACAEVFADLARHF